MTYKYGVFVRLIQFWSPSHPGSICDEEKALRKAQLKNNLFLLIGTVGLNIFCISVLILYQINKTTRDFLSVANTFFQTYLGYAVWDMYALPLLRSFSFGTIVLQPAVHFTADLNCSLGVLIHVLFSSVYRELFLEKIKKFISWIKLKCGKGQP